MLPLEVFLSVVLLCLVSVLGVPLKSRALNPAVVQSRYQAPSQIGLRGSIPSTNPPPYTIECLESRPDLHLATVAADCTILVNELIIRGDDPFHRQYFTQHRYSDRNNHRTPARWAVGQCNIYFEAVPNVHADHLAFIEVAVIVKKILSDCKTSHLQGGGRAISNEPHRISLRIGMQGYLVDTNVNGSNDSGLPLLSDSRVSKRALDAKTAIRSLTRPQRRILNSGQALVPVGQAISLSNKTGSLKTVTDHEVECFPRGSRLSRVVEDDCRFIIDNMIIGMKDPFRVQTWGFTDDVDINLSLPEYDWLFKGCYIRVRNVDEEEVDKFRPVDVAEQAQRILETCVVDTKEGLGGYVDIGHLRLAQSFYVVVAGSEVPDSQSPGSSNLLSLPSDRPSILESRADLELPQENTISSTVTGSLEADTEYPVHCFDPVFVHHLKPAIISDCEIIINEMIPRLPNPMLVQSFGYTNDEDINLSIKENGRWIYGQCVVFVRSPSLTGRDMFRFADIALTAKRIITECVEGTKYARGGTADIGTLEGNFYVSVGGLSRPSGGNGTVLVLGTDKVV